MLYLLLNFEKRGGAAVKTEKSKLHIGRVALFALMALLLTAMLVPVFAFAASAADYSRPGFSGTDYNKEVGSAELLSDIMGLSVSDEERRYLDEYGSFSIVYPKSIPASYITLTKDGGNIRIEAREYSYIADNGLLIVCVPKSIVFSGGEPSELMLQPTAQEGEYSLVYTPPSVAADFKLDVKYSLDIEIPKDGINSALAAAYNDARWFSYLLEYEGYETALLEYNAYLAEKRIYDEKYGDYLNYLEELSDYEASLAAYKQYCLDIEKYNADYLLYLDSLKKAEGLEDEIAAYNAYLAEMEKVSYRLALLDDTKLKLTEHGRTLYWAIHGNAVDEVLENESLLTGNVVGADKEAVRKAGTATKMLRVLLEDYFKKTTDEEKYIYYKLNYGSISMYFRNLFASLDNLYENEAVRDMIALKGKSENFDILLAQLYLACHALTDGAVYKFDGVTPYTSSYKIRTENGEKTPLEILGVTDYYADKDIAAPASGDLYPAPVPVPEYIPLPEPEKPAEVLEPIAPVSVTEPKAPAELTAPKEPVRPLESSSELKPPFEAGSAVHGLVLAYKAGKLSSRDDKLVSSNLTKTFEIFVTKALNPEIVTVTYHDMLGAPVGDILVDSGSLADIDYTPEKPETDKASYVFSGWVDTDGNAVNLSAVSTDVSVFPSFKEVKKTCNITWIVDGVSTVIPAEYDSVPEYGTVPEKEGAASYYYVFSGWDTEPEAVTADAVYTAVFEKKYTVPELENDSAVSIADDGVTVDCGSSMSIKLDISRLVADTAGKYSMKFKLSEAELSLSFAELAALKDSGVTYMSVSRQSEGFGLSVHFSDSDGNEMENSVKLGASVSLSEYKSSMRLCASKADEKQYVKYSYADGKITFVLNTGYTYTVISENSVSVFSYDGASVSADKTAASAGELITVSVSIPQNTRLIEIYYIKSDGTKTVITDGSFIMPDSSVTVGVSFESIKYTVTFISDGIVVGQYIYVIGSAVTPPPDPTKPADEDYTYSFGGWTPAIGAVYGDAVYTATYIKTAIEKTDDGGLKISDGVLRLLVTGGLSAAVVLLGALPSAVISVILAAKRRRMRKK